AGLLRGAGVPGEVTIARAYGPFNDGFANTNGNGRGGGRVLQAFARHYEISAGAVNGRTESGDELYSDVLRHLSAPWAPDSWIFVSDHASIGVLAEAIHQQRKRAVLWGVDTPALPLTMKTLVDHFVPLQWVLDLRPHTVGLFVDYENVARSLAKQGYFVDPATLARGLAERARAMGQVLDARAY